MAYAKPPSLYYITKGGTMAKIKRIGVLVRCRPELRDDFQKVCKKLETCMSDQLRRYMKKVVDEYGKNTR